MDKYSQSLSFSGDCSIRASDRRFLMLGGPFGPFFSELASELERAGSTALHINMHLGDRIDWGSRNAIRFNGRLADWVDAFTRIVQEQKITDLISYGDCSPYAEPALPCARSLGLRVHVFEMGYFRPDWITLERDGVNGFSNIPRLRGFYDAQNYSGIGRFEKVGRMMPYHVGYTIRHCLLQFLARPFSPPFDTPWQSPPAYQAAGYIGRVLTGSAARRRYQRTEADLLAGGSPYFLCALQKPGDSQIRVHSPFENIAEFVEMLVADFAANAPRNTKLVFKGHPLDNGMEPLEQKVVEAGEKHSIADRLVYLPTGSLSLLTKSALGLVTINSTSGLAALDHDRPTKVMGTAFYDIDGLTHQGSLGEFWSKPQKPEQDLFHKFRAYVMRQTQINGSFYAPKGRKMAVPAAAKRLLSEE